MLKIIKIVKNMLQTLRRNSNMDGFGDTNHFGIHHLLIMYKPTNIVIYEQKSKAKN